MQPPGNLQYVYSIIWNNVCHHCHICYTANLMPVILEKEHVERAQVPCAEENLYLMLRPGYCLCSLCYFTLRPLMKALYNHITKAVQFLKCCHTVENHPYPKR